MQEHVDEQLGAYALGILDTEEAFVVRAHLEWCAECRRELDVLQAVVGQISLATPGAAPSVELKARLMARTGRTRSVPTAGRRHWWAGLKGRLIRPVPAWSLGIATLALFVVLGVLLMGSPAGGQVGWLATIILQASDAAPGATGLLVLSADGEYGSLVVDGLPNLDLNHQYQLWLIKDGARTSGGLFGVHDGYAMLEVAAPDALSSYDQFGVTIEPKGGSSAPTGEKVLGSP